MFLECFLHDEPSQDHPWVWDVWNPHCYIVGPDGIETRAGRGHVFAPPLPITSRLESLAEEMLAKAADLNSPLPREEILRRYASEAELDVPLGQFLHLRGRIVAVPEPQYLGIFASGPGGANLILYNLWAVRPVLGSYLV